MGLCIALDAQSTLGQKSGIGLYTANLLDALRRVAPCHDYVELTWVGHTEQLRTDRRLWWEQVGLPRRARAVHADLLHLTGFGAPRFAPCPTVLTVHDLIGLLFPAYLPPISRFYWARWLPRTICWADHIVADSEHTRRDIVARLGVPAARVHVVPLGVGRAYHPIADRAALDALRRKYDLPPMLILYVGTLEPRKGLDTLIAAYAHLAVDMPHGLVIAGKKGWYTESIFHQVQRFGLERRVRFANYVPDNDLPGLYNLADLFVYPSRYEGFGLPPLEAMACGVPVVCSNAASLPEVVGDAGLLVPPDDADALAAAMRRMLTDGDLRAAMRQRGLERAKCFDWDETARHMVAIYEQAARR